jgi:hypothetical protein
MVGFETAMDRRSMRSSTCIHLPFTESVRQPLQFDILLWHVDMKFAPHDASNKDAFFVVGSYLSGT